MFPHGPPSTPGFLENLINESWAYLDAYGTTLALGIAIGLGVAMICNLLVEKPYRGSS